MPVDAEDLAAALRGGDETAFGGLVDELSPGLHRVARSYVGSAAVAEEVVQETWIAVIQGLARFEGRSTLSTWIFGICVNQARRRAASERRSLPFSSVGVAAEDTGPAVDPDRFLPSDDPRGPCHWSSVPRRFDHLPEDRLLGAETRALVSTAIEALPGRQRLVISLRDVEGLSAEEVSRLLDVTPGNQRVLLHRARSAVRRALEAHVERTPSVASATQQRTSA